MPPSDGTCSSTSTPREIVAVEALLKWCSLADRPAPRLDEADLKSSIIRSGQCPAGSWETELLSMDQGSASRRPYRSDYAPANRTITPPQNGPRGTLPCT